MHSTPSLRPADISVSAPMCPPSRLLTLKQVMELVQLRKTKIYQLIGEATFPQPVKPGGHASRWIEREIADWIDAQAAARQTLH